MRTRSVTIASLVIVVAVLGDVGCQLRARALTTEAAWLLERAQAMADAYVHTFNGAYVDRQLATYQERRAVLERAHLWQEGTVALVLVAIAAAFVAAASALHRKLRYEVESHAGGPIPALSSTAPRELDRAAARFAQPSR